MDPQLVALLQHFLVSLLYHLPVKTDPNLGNRTQTRNAENANKNGHKQTRLNLRETLRQDCKTFIHRFDSDRRLQYLKKVNGLRRYR